MITSPWGYSLDHFSSERAPTMADISRLPNPLIEEYEWQYDGACRRVEPERFFSPDYERGALRQSREDAAKAIFAHCPVIERCLSHVLQVKEPYGFWGGLNPHERVKLATKPALVMA